MREISKKQRRAVTLALGEAMFEAVGLLVRQYLTGDAGADEESFLMEESFETERVMAAETVNESFDDSRFRALQESIERTAKDSAGSDAAETLVRSGDRAMEESAALSRGIRQSVRSGEEKEALREKTVHAEDISLRMERDARRYDGGFLLD